MQQQSQSRKNWRILIVEDVPTMRELIVWIIEQIPGLAVSDAVDSVPAARLALDRRRPDLVLLDRILPGPLGDDLIPYLKSQNIPYWLLVTSDSPESNPGITPENLKDTLLVKPFGESREALDRDLARIQQAISKKLGAVLG